MQKIRVFDLVNKNQTVRELKQDLLKLPAFTPCFAATRGGKILYCDGISSKRYPHIGFMLPSEVFSTFKNDVAGNGMTIEKTQTDENTYIICFRAKTGLLKGVVANISEKDCNALYEYSAKILAFKEFVAFYEKRFGIKEQRFALSRKLSEKAVSLDTIRKLGNRKEGENFDNAVLDLSGACEKIAKFMSVCGAKVCYNIENHVLVGGVTPFFSKICIGTAGLAAAWSWDNSIEIKLKTRDENTAVLTFSGKKERREISRLYEQYFKEVLEKNGIPFLISHENGIHISFYLNLAKLRVPMLKESERLQLEFDNTLMLEETRLLAQAMFEI